MHIYLIFGLLTALSFGVADFLAGLVGRRMSPLTLVFYSQAIGSFIIALLTIIYGGQLSFSELVWGGAAGLVLGLGYIFYYHALSTNKMGVSAAVTGVWTAFAPFVFGVFMGERPSALGVLGIFLVMLAIALVSGWKLSFLDEDARQAKIKNCYKPPFIEILRLFIRSKLLHASLAGLWLGLFFVFLDQPKTDNPMWTATAATVSSALVVGLLVPFVKPSLIIKYNSLWIVICVGVFQILGTLTFIVAAQEGMLSVVAVAGALTPVPTAILAYLILREKLTSAQSIGMFTALAGIVLMMRA